MSTSFSVNSIEVVDLTLSDDECKFRTSFESSTPDVIPAMPTATLAAQVVIETPPPANVSPAAIVVSDPPRRSQRDLATMSTIIYIDGHPVKKSNNYSVTEGEYIYGDNNQYDSVSPSAKRRAKLAETNAAKKKSKMIGDTAIVAAAAATRKVSPQELARQTHNQRVRNSKDSKQSLRRAFLKDKVEILKPFLEPSVYRNLAEEERVDRSEYTPIPVDQPKLVSGGALRDYQLEGISFLVNHHRRNLGMILGDEMGLGKTVQTISLLSYLKETEKKTGPSLVVCPLSVLSSWMKELAFWAPTLKVFRLHNSSASGQEKSRQALLDSVVDYDIVLTTYEMVKTPHLKSMFTRLHFHYMILDEGHKVKCSDTQISGAVRKVHCENRLLLTGTPLQNNLVELWSLLELLYPEVFTTKTPFEKSFNLNENHVDAVMLLHAQKLLELFMIRRLKSRVEKLLPERLETRVYCPLSKEQVFLYKALLMKDVSFLERLENNVTYVDNEEAQVSKSNRARLQNLFMQLRKVSQHPYLFDGMQTSDATIKDMVAASGKLAVLDMLLISLCKKGHRCVIFSQFTMVLDVLEDYCLERGWNYARFDGGTSRAKRDYLVNRFNEKNSPFFLFLMSTKSGGVGLNLQSADTTILFDSDWNPQNDLQAMARVHRIGQTKTVHVYRLVTSNSVEERMVERANKKLLLDHSVNRECASKKVSNDDGSGLSVKDLLRDIKFGANAVFGQQNLEDLPSWKDIELITDRSRKDSDCLGKLKGGTEENGFTFDAEKEYSPTQVFGGFDYRRIREANERKLLQETPKCLQGIGELWQSIKAIEGKKREKKSRLLMVDGKGSGYGESQVPILASNNYDLQSGETSVFGRELGMGQKKLAALPPKRKAKFSNSEFCQNCLDGGTLVCCPNCPVSLHLQCCGLTRVKDFHLCWHHHCNTCGKKLAEAGGLLFRCAACPFAYCDDCVPVNSKGFRYLDSHQLWEELGFDSTKNSVYIHCNAECENFAQKEFGWQPKSSLQTCPKQLDVSFNFGFYTEHVTLGVSQPRPTPANIIDLSGGIHDTISTTDPRHIEACTKDCEF